MFHRFLHDFATLFVVTDPVGLVPLFIAFAGHQDGARQRAIAIQAVLIAGGILLAFILLGQPLLQALAIDLTSFQIAGGIVLLLTGLRMVLAEARPEPHEGSGSAHGSVAVYPLATPFIAGPATIMAVVLLTDNDVYTVTQQVETAIVLLLVLAITCVAMASAAQVQRLIGVTGANVVSRVMGLLLAALAVQAIVTAVRRVAGI